MSAPTPIRLRNITIQLLPDDDTPIDPDLQEKTWFLHSAFKLKSDVIIGDAAPNMDVSALGRLWEHVQPKDGVFTFEIATELPYYLPMIDGKHEYSVTVDGAELFVSLRMLKAAFEKGLPEDRGTAYLLVHRRGLQSAISDQGMSGIHPIPIRSFISRRFSAAGTSAEEVIQTNFYAWADAFVSNIAHFMDAVRATNPTDTKHLLPYVTVSSFPFFWIVADGRGCAQFVGDVGTAALRSGYNIPRELLPKLRRLLQQGLSPYEHAISLARTYCHYGYHGLAVVQLCVACEIVLAREYHAYLATRGVSNSAIKGNKREITFSQLLQIHLFSMRNIASLPDWQHVVDRINWARRHRNDVVHEGALQEVVSESEVDEAISCSQRLIDFLLAPVAAMPSGEGVRVSPPPGS